MQTLINFLYFVAQLMVAYLFVCAAIDYACKKNCDYKVKTIREILEAINNVIGANKNVSNAVGDE